MTDNKLQAQTSPPTMATLASEFGVMLFVVAAWAQAHGTLVNASWAPVGAIAVAGILFGPVKLLVILPEREQARKTKSRYVVHLAKAAVLALGCSLGGILIAQNVGAFL